MPRAVAPQRIDRLRFNVGPNSNQLTALGNTFGFPAAGSRGVEAATAASTHAGHKEAEDERSSNDCDQLYTRTLRKKIRLRAGSVDQLNFEFARNKDLMTVFIIRLRRVYQD